MALISKRQLMLKMLMIDEGFNDNTLDLHLTYYCFTAVKRRKRFWGKLRNYYHRIENNHMEWINLYTDYQFYRLFRMQRRTFFRLLEKIMALDKYGLMKKKFCGGNYPVPPEKALLVFLRYIGSQETLNALGDRFSITDSTVMQIVNGILFLVTSLKSKYIFWPKTQEEINHITNGFSNYPGTLGAVDGSHVNIKVPTAQHDSYVDRYLNHSINLMAICTSEKLFTYIFVGFPGSAHDARVFDHSCFVRNIERDGPKKYFFDEERYHIIGDSAFPLKTWLMKPYSNTVLTQVQRNHNYKLSADRVAIENIFGILKGRWARLQFINTYSVSKSVEIVSASCVLHNFCLLNMDEWNGEVIDDRHNQNEDIPENYRDNITAQHKRNRITAELMG